MIYAVNKRTKEHRGWDDSLAAHDDWLARCADADGWIPWPGGECPLPDGAPFEARRRDGEIAARVDSWLHGYGDRDIIAYRPILADEEEKCPIGSGVTVHYDLASAAAECAIKCKLIDMGWTPPQDEAPAWDGEGLPPVGVECECTFAVDGHETWHRGVATLRGVAPEGHEIVAIKVGGITAVYRSRKHIRPIRSEEDRAVDDMAKVMKSVVPRSGDKRPIEDVALALYRAGYRKQGE